MKKTFAANNGKVYFFKSRIPWPIIRLWVYTMPEWRVKVVAYFRGKSAPKRFPQDYTRTELSRVLLDHLNARVAAETKVSKLTEKLKEAQIKLSEAKRGN